MSTRIRKLGEQFRIGETKYFLKKRTGQVALYAKFARYDNSILGFDVFKLETRDLGKTLDFGPLCLLEVFPKAGSPNLASFTSEQEVEAWTAFQNLIDKQARKC